MDAFARLREIGADIVGVNCMNGPNEMVQLLQRVPVSGQLLAAYPNAGHPKYTDGRFIYHTAPDYFAKAARQMVVEGARLIGGCCGTNPGHVAAMSAAIADLRPVRSKLVRVVAEAPPRIRKTKAALTGKACSNELPGKEHPRAGRRRKRRLWRNSLPEHSFDRGRM
jgi:hypothetical protein